MLGEDVGRIAASAAAVEPERSFVVYPGADRFRLAPGIEAVDPAGLCEAVEERA